MTVLYSSNIITVSERGTVQVIGQIEKLPKTKLYRDQIVDGRLYEIACELFSDILPKPGIADIREKLLYAMKELNRYSITTCQTDDFGAIAGADWEQIISAYRELEVEGKMTVRVYEQCLFAAQEAFEKFLQAGCRIRRSRRMMQ